MFIYIICYKKNHPFLWGHAGWHVCMLRSGNRRTRPIYYLFITRTIKIHRDNLFSLHNLYKFKWFILIITLASKILCLTDSLMCENCYRMSSHFNKMNEESKRKIFSYKYIYSFQIRSSQCLKIYLTNLLLYGPVAILN